MSGSRYKRILLKLSGEALMGTQSFGIDSGIISAVAGEIKEIVDLGVETAVVVGGGNIFRGIAASSYSMDRTAADHMGMLATVINCIALQGALEDKGVQTRVQTALTMHEVAEPYILRKAVRHLEKGRVVLFGAGTGNPYFTTDTAAVLRALEIHAEVFLKATKVDGLYDSDPVKNHNAAFIKRTSYMEVLQKQLRVMDMTAVSLAMDNALPLIIFNLTITGNIKNVICGEEIGTLITNNHMETVR